MPSESEDRPAVTRDGENLWPATQPPNTVSEQSVPATTPPLPGGDGIVGPRLPDYEVLGELGRGGMGVVYKARQIALKRLVALKMILAGSHAGPEHLERFQREAEAVARLQHPNIVQVHETGQWRSEGSDALLPYFSLEFVEGGSLDRYLAGTPQLPEESAQLLQALARAIHAAHQAGIVHRDLKPANILLANLTLGGEQPRLSTLTPKITDFGLAKQLDADVGQTQSGAIMGTPAYMAPEQASGRIRAIGPATDVWALGAILYECLTGRTPFKAANLASTLAQILTQEPVPPTRLAPKTPRDLETICLKCLEKEPRKRYPSAQALAEDLGRFLEGKPIHARPVGALERLRKWSRRQPAVATLAATVLVVFLTGFGLVLWQLWEAQAARDRADQNAKDYRDASEEATKHARTAETETAKALRALKDRDQALGVRDVSLYVSNMNLVQRHWERGDVPAVLALLAKHVPAPGQPDLRGFEWHYYWHLCHAALKVATDLPGPVKAVACAPDGARLAIGCLDGSVLMWETSSSKKPTLLVKAGQAIRAVAFAPDGKTLAWATGAQDVPGLVALWDVPGGKQRVVLRGHQHPITALAFSPDGKRLLSTAAALVTTSRGDPSETYFYEVGVGKGQGDWKLWDVEAAREVPGWPVLTEGVLSVAFAPDGKEILVSLVDGGVQRRTFPDGKQVENHALPFRSWAVAYQPAGKTFATVGGVWGQPGQARLWQRSVAAQPHALQGHADGILAGVFAPDGRTLATTSFDHTVRLWDAVTGEPAGAFKGHEGPVTTAAFSPEGRFVATGGADATVRLWDMAASQEWTALGGARLWYGGSTVRWSPDSATLAVSSAVGQWRLWDTRALTLRSTVQAWSALFAPDGRVWGSGLDENAHFCLRDLTPGTERPPQTLPTGTRSLSVVSPDFRYAAFLHNQQPRPRRLSVWQLATGACLVDAENALIGSPVNLAFSPDGSRLAFSGQMNQFRVWDVRAGKLLVNGDLKGYMERIVFSPDGKLLATGETLGRVRVWETDTLKPVADFRGHMENVFAVAFSPEGRFLVTGSRGDNRIRFWDLVTHEERLTLPAPANVVWDLAFSPNGQTLAAVSGGQVVLYRAPRDAGGKKPLPQMSTVDWHRLQSEYADADWHQLQAEARGSAHHPFALAFHRDRLVEARPLDPAVWLQRARGHFVAGNVESALRDCDRSLKLNSSDGEAWLLRAQCHIERGSWDEAAADLQQALKLTAGAKQHLLHALAGVQLRRKDPEGYREVCRELLVLGRAARKRSAADREEFLQAVWISSLSPVDGMDREQLIQEIKPLLTALPEDYLAMMAYALALVRSDKFADAAALLAKANKLHPDAPSVWLLLALAVGRQGQRDEARQWLARAVTWHDQAKKGGPAPRGQLTWQQLLWIQREAFELLRREAENLLAR